MTEPTNLISLLAGMSWDQLKQLRDELKPYTGTYAEAADDSFSTCRHCGHEIDLYMNPDDPYGFGEWYHVNSTEKMCTPHDR